MDDLIQAAQYFRPQEKSITEQCTGFIKENPTTVAKGLTVGVAAWYVVPIVFGMIGWLPYIGASYYVYQNTRASQSSYSWYQRAKSWVA